MSETPEATPTRPHVPDGVVHPHPAGAACQRGHVRGAARSWLWRDPGVDRASGWCGDRAARRSGCL